MKSVLRFSLLVSFIFAMASGVSAKSREAQWDKVEAAQQKGLPKTAIEELKPIIAAAIADKDYPEAIKAIGEKIALEGKIEGNKPEEQIVRLQAELEQAPAAMKPLMEAILAHLYWGYFQQHRWQFMQRTQLAAESGPDMKTWDLSRILTEIDRHFTAALADKRKLQTTPISDYDELLPKGTVPDQYRPTLYDFLAYEALKFYQAGEHAARKAEDNFEADASSPIFGDVAAFEQWQPVTTDDTSPILKAIRLYQDLLKFHQADKDRSAYYDADLARLTYGHNIAIGENKDDRYKAALERFVEVTARHEISARALAVLASVINQEGDAAKAHELAGRGLSAFPKSAGGALCFNLIQQIEAKTAQLETESVWNAPWPTLNVTYRNVTKVYFRAVSANFDDYISRARWGFGNLDDAQRKELLATRPTLEWNATLPQTADYKQRTEDLPAPTTLKPGFYFIVASHNATFGDKENQISVAAIWVSDLALIIRSQPYGNSHGGFVLKANSGLPVVAATVRLWQPNNQGAFIEQKSTKTDSDGRFQLPDNGRNQGYLLLAESNGQAVSSDGIKYSNHYQDPNLITSETVFFTDRALYRPGQTISYKGICLKSDRVHGSYKTLADEEVEVSFRDANGKEVARAKHTTNDYGSFAGTFTAPRDRLRGNMSIVVSDGPKGNADFNVEEYKRPKFHVELNAPSEAPKLNTTVSLRGKATAYTGAAIGGAKVKWHVERATTLPWWLWWWRPPATKAIAHGIAVTAPDGTFTIEFTAEPDRTIPEKNEPTFAYSIHADVTDTTGETRSEDRTIRGGYTALKASLTAEEWQTPQKPVEFAIETASLNGDAQAASGKLTINALKQPLKVERTSLQRTGYWWNSNQTEPRVDPANPNSWDVGAVVSETPFATDALGKTKVSATLQAGIYRATLETKDRFGKAATARLIVEVVDPHEAHYTVKLPNHFSSPKWSVEPGETFRALWGTGYDSGRAFVEVKSDGEVFKSYWTDPTRTQELIELPITEEMRGGVTVRVTYVRENRAYFNEHIVQVPWTNKELSIKWEHFRSKLIPGQKETWTAIISSSDSKRAAAEMVATLYDASLDQFRPHNWPERFNVFRSERTTPSSDFTNKVLNFGRFTGKWSEPSRDDEWEYREFPESIFTAIWGPGDDIIVLSPFAITTGTKASLAGSRIGGVSRKETFAISGMGEPLYDIATGKQPIKPDLNKVIARKNLNETAFFFPQLLADKDGVVKMVFTMPEALTEWKFLGFAHDQELRSGFITAKVVTAKDLMVEPNPPRFVREGDEIEFTVKVSNQSDQPQKGTVRLTFADAATLKSEDAALGNLTADKPFDVPAKQSRSYSWRIAIPDGMDFLTYKAVGSSAQLSDGEEGYLPVLSRRILVTESLPLPIRGKTTKEFDFKKLLDSGNSTTLKNESLTVQMVSQPAWYAVMALPYLMEYPYECSEQVFNRYYANALARHIAQSDPKIRRVFDLWKNTAALESPLAKNQDLKSVMLEETPWVQQANSETQARHNVGLLFDANRLDAESAHALQQLADRQLNDGLWSWFPGGPPSNYISLYIMTGFGRMRHLDVDIDPAPALKSLDALDAWMEENYREIQKLKHPDQYVPTYTAALYLYGRSFFLKERPLAKQNQAALDFFLRQGRKYWLSVDSRQCQAQLAIALQRLGDQTTPQDIMKSLKERSVSNKEMGMFWRDTESSWWWYEAPIETQAMMIEAFDEVAHDAQAVEDCKVWLLKQKQTQDWRTTKATAEAIYGLLLHGENLLASDALVQVSLGGKTIEPTKTEAGTGFYEQKFIHDEINPAMGRITVTKSDNGISWGSVHWQYLEDMSKVTPHEGTPLRLTKTLFVKESTKSGSVLKPVTGPLAVGDELVVRLELRTDRDMEFVHLKDERGSGTEPVNVLSGYKYQDGLAYYETTRDTASHFFIDYLRKGTYVFEYSTRIQLKGTYQTGIAEIQCMYAPEFNSHSESFTLEVK
ncbi:MAG TPA: alpha-2-macroglobulin family protein [Lacunisphaera sp.]|jgi:uncharacterized protein YfaS (alpha-2-macroglobulin family)